MSKVSAGSDVVAKQGTAIGAITDVPKLQEVVRNDPGGPSAELALARIAQLLSVRIRQRKSAPRGDKASTYAGSLSRARATIGNTGWVNLVPQAIRDEILVDLVAAFDALLEDLQKSAEQARVADSSHGITRSVERAAQLSEAFGFHAALHGLLKDLPRRERSVGFEALAGTLAARNRDAALRAYWLAYAFNPSPAKANKIAQRMFKAGNISSAGALIKLAEDQCDGVFGAELRLAARLFKDKPRIPAVSERKGAADIQLAYVASSSIAHQLVGYTVRTHQILTALNDIGVRAKCFVRPGYPWDRSSAVSGTPVANHYVDGVAYAYTKILDIASDPESHVERMADALARRFQAARPSVVQAASNHRNALPALIAARRIGVPFIYELRGLWELTTASRVEGWEDTERFALERSLELTVASEADRVLTITEGVANELVVGGVAREKIELLPNAVDPDRFKPIDPDPRLTQQLQVNGYDLVLVYCGSMLVYEGLDDLLEAIAILRRRRIKMRLLLVGNGVFRDRLRSLVTQHQLQSLVTFLDPVSPEDVHRYWSLADVVALPRKPFKVCQVVSPLKPFEAMAMGKPVILSDLPVSREIVDDGVTGFLCAPADPSSLAAILEKCAKDPALRRKMGKAARDWVASNRSWAENARILKALYAGLAR